MRVTIITDASFCPNTRVAGYGYWLASDRGSKAGMGVMTTQRIVSNVAAEMMAVANTLHDCKMQKLLLPGDSVLMQTDCVAAINAFTSVRTLNSMHEQEQNVVEYVWQFVKHFELEIRYRHVKGHSSQQGNRYLANHKCDQRAKNAMRVARDRILRVGPQQNINPGETA